MTFYTPPAVLAALGLTTYEPATGSGSFLINPPFAMTEPPPGTLCHTLYHDRIIGLTVTARPGPEGQWIVNFVRRKRMTKQLDQCAAWLPFGRWDDTRWHPVGARLVPPAALAAVEAWLMVNAAVEVAS